MTVVVETTVLFDQRTERDKIEKFIRDNREGKWKIRESTITAVFTNKQIYCMTEKDNEGVKNEISRRDNADDGS